jgi:tetratricopeptide (TPR) repeat protein
MRGLVGMPQKAIAMEMGVEAAYISQLENGHRKITPEVLMKIKKALDISDVPLTDEEITVFEKQLHDWDVLLIDNDVDEAKRIQPDLARCAELSLEPRLQTAYTLISIGFYLKTGDMATADEIISSLSDRQHEFTAEQSFRYFFAKGICELHKKSYKSAIESLLNVEKLNRQLNIAGSGLYYNLAIAYSAIDYSQKAEEYIAIARKKADETNYKEMDVYMDSITAMCYSNYGKYEKALDLLQSCLRREKMKIGAIDTVGRLYHNIGCVYLKKEDWCNAVINFDNAFQYLERNGLSYINNLYHKARTLFEQGYENDGLALIDEGLMLSESNELYNTMLTALKLSIDLDNKENMMYIEEQAIPGLLAAGMHLAVLDYCGKLKRHFEKVKKLRNAFKYADMALKIYTQISKGDVLC